ncbi:MAG TPA: hypothetical protein PLH19_09970 [Anaerolineae bacterium]|nr:hypothetical protein [Anaerolineae bacterium]HQH38843.1 hypothetical protein [Anaerolineae bacterium]
MTYTMYSQLYDGWKRMMLGQSATTIGQYGCLLCAVASGLTDVGVTIDGLPPDPPRLNRWLTRNGGFMASADTPQEQNLFVFGAPGALGAHLVEYVDCGNIPAPMHKIQAALAQSKTFVVIQVDFNPGDGQPQQHWVRAVEWFDADLKIMDPWLAEPGHDLYLMTRYALPTWDGPARAIYRLAIYRYDLAGVPFVPGAAVPIVQESLCGYPY